MKPKKKTHGRRAVPSKAARKVSDMVWEFAGWFIKGGETPEDKQHRLNAACSAWNIACNPPEARKRLLNQYIESYRSYNPEESDEQISDVRRVMEKLIQNKLSLLPAVHKQIVGAQITQVAGKDRIDVVSARFE